MTFGKLLAKGYVKKMEIEWDNLKLNPVTVTVTAVFPRYPRVTLFQTGSHSPAPRHATPRENWN